MHPLFLTTPLGVHRARAADRLDPWPRYRSVPHPLLQNPGLSIEETRIEVETRPVCHRHRGIQLINRFDVLGKLEQHLSTVGQEPTASPAPHAHKAGRFHCWYRSREWSTQTGSFGSPWSTPVLSLKGDQLLVEKTTPAPGNNSGHR